MIFVSTSLKSKPVDCSVFVAMQLGKQLPLQGQLVHFDLSSLRQWQAKAPVSPLLLGAGTGSPPWQASLKGLVDFELIGERGTNLAAAGTGPAAPGLG
ncbi:MAG: hypothetical protein ACK6BU_10275 [Cyanobacteriota bacterium]